MAKVWLMMMLLIVHNVFADNIDIKNNCDMCIRSGRKWCRENTKYGHCISVVQDDSCPSDNYEKWQFKDNNTDGDLFQPMYAERILYMHDFDPQSLIVTYASATEKKVSINFLNMTGEVKINVYAKKAQCNTATSSCTVEILAKPHGDFCSHHEYAVAILTFEGLSEEVRIKYNVACSCECSKYTVVQSENCSYHGNYTCGVCNCESEWSGDNCNEKVTCDVRGDQEQSCTTDIRDEQPVDCNDNGKCVCGDCKCFEDRIGSQYYDQTDMCADVCQQTIECSNCLQNETLGSCQDCNRNLTLLELKEDIAKNAVDQKNRLMWIHCKENKDEYDFEYYAMRVEKRYFVMLKKYNATNDKHIVAATAAGKVPLILGLIGLIALVAMGGGFLVWKYMQKPTDSPATGSQYANIDAEDCTGVNPIYKPPMSCFINPTYGKKT